MTCRWVTLVALVGFMNLMTSETVRADGGTMRFSKRLGDYQVSVFTAPTPLRVGAVDICIMVQDARTGQVRLDLPVAVRAFLSDGKEASGPTEATNELATNKLLLAAMVELRSEGTWTMEASIKGQNETLMAQFDVEVLPPIPPWFDLSLWIGWPFVAVGLFTVHQCLVYRKKARS